MEKINKDEFTKLLKRICITFIFFALIWIAITKLLQYNKPIELYRVLFYSSIGSLCCNYGYFKYYKRYNKKIILEETSSSDTIFKLKEIMKNMHWSIKNIDNKQLVFKSSALRTFLTEYLTINIDKNSLEFEGPKYYVEKVVESLLKNK